MKAITRSTSRRLGIRPVRRSATKFGSPSAARPNAVADMPVRCRNASTSARKISDESIPTAYRNSPIFQEAKSYSPIVKEISYIGDMDRVRNLIVKAAEEKGASLKSLSIEMGVNHAYLQQFIKRQKPRDLPERIRDKLAPLLGLKEHELRPDPSRTADLVSGSFVMESKVHRDTGGTELQIILYDETTAGLAVVSNRRILGEHTVDQAEVDRLIGKLNWLRKVLGTGSG
jgi:lambda repressor-like predicted transcriptional regulator